MLFDKKGEFFIKAHKNKDIYSWIVSSLIIFMFLESTS